MHLSATAPFNPLMKRRKLRLIIRKLRFCLLNFLLIRDFHFVPALLKHLVEQLILGIMRIAQNALHRFMQLWILHFQQPRIIPGGQVLLIC